MAFILMSMNATSFLHLIGHKVGKAQYMQLGLTCLNPSPLYMGSELAPQLQDDYYPPPGLIQWHYLQCVIQKFAHGNKQNLQNIHS